ncbi:MAG: hypothetical protein RLZZ08_176 [Pseudomonadota bacterium]|jgi:two-component system chemotaxis response regulator CheB
MRDARVLVVDDSAAMRALFCDILEQARNVQVVGVAANADEARERIGELRPNVLTLDVEMPGKSGIEFLEELMEDSPMPVVMLSSITQAGTDAAMKALELGAVECFPKPLRVSPEQFNATVAKLGKIVLAAANSKPRERKPVAAPAGQAAQALPAFAWNGTCIALSGSMGAIDALQELLLTFPANCPPTVVAIPVEPALAEAVIAKFDASLPCSVRKAEDGAPLVPGVIHVAYDPGLHVLVEAGEPAVLRLVARDPVGGVRPSADLLFGTLARAGVKSTAAVLSGYGADGVKGLKLLGDQGSATFAQSPDSAMVSQAPEAALEAGGAQSVALPLLGGKLLDACRAA